MKNILTVANRSAFRAWLQENGATETECYLCLKRGAPKDDGVFYYLDAVEEALCFGWIDSTLKNIDGTSYQRFSPRAPKSNWTELNKARARRLERLGLMTDMGRQVLPDMAFVMPEDVLSDIGEVAHILPQLPPLYVKVRLCNLKFTKEKTPEQYPGALKNFIENTKAKKLYGQWNDYGRLKDDK